MFRPAITKVSEDARGEIYVITLPGNKELLLLHSKAGSIRGGHSHDVDEVVVLLTGEMKYTKRNESGAKYNYEQDSTLKGGHASFNPKGEYHVGEFLEDSWLLEWKINTHKGGWKNRDYAPWRERVRANAASK